MEEDGSFSKVNVFGKEYSGKELYDALDGYARKAYYSKQDISEKKKGQDIIWYIWAGPNSPVFGKDKMTTFERYFVAEKETHKEKKNSYYQLMDNEDVLNIKDVDIAFLPVNQPYTMTVEQAARVVKAIKPQIFYPYHYGQVDEKTDIEALKKAVEGVTEVRVFPME